MACAAGAIMAHATPVAMELLVKVPLQAMEDHDLCSTAAPSPVLTARRGKAPHSPPPELADEHLSTDGGSLRAPEDEVDDQSSSDESEGAEDVAGLAAALRRYVLANSSAMPEDLPPQQPSRLLEEVDGDRIEEDESSESDGDVLRFRLAVRGYAQRCTHQC